MSFGPAVDQPRGWCNLCRAAGAEFLFDPTAPDAFGLLEQHTALAHPAHTAALAAGAGYAPVEVEH